MYKLISEYGEVIFDLRGFKRVENGFQGLSGGFYQHSIVGKNAKIECTPLTVIGRQFLDGVEIIHHNKSDKGDD